MELVFLCARSEMDDSRIEAASRLTRRGLDWDRVADLSDRIRVKPLVFRNLSAHVSDDVPSSVLSRLQSDYQIAARRGMVLAGELIRITEALDLQGLPAVPFKGPILAAQLYGDLTLREFDDIDILVHRKDVVRATSILQSRGYRPELEFTAAQQAAYLDYGWALHFVHELTGAMVDLHWNLTHPLFFRLDTEGLWTRFQPGNLLGKQILTLSPDDLLLLLCVHGCKHRWIMLDFVCSIAELLRSQPSLDWEYILGEATKLGGRRMLLLGVILASELLDVSLPGNVELMAWQEPSISRLSREATRRLVHGGAVDPALHDRLQWFDLEVRERLSDRLRLCLRPLRGSPREWSMIPLPRALFPLYHFLRPFGLAVRYGQRLWTRTSQHR